MATRNNPLSLFHHSITRCAHHPWPSSFRTVEIHHSRSFSEDFLKDFPFWSVLLAGTYYESLCLFGTVSHCLFSESGQLQTTCASRAAMRQPQSPNLNPMSARLLRIQSWEKVALAGKFQPEAMAALCLISLRTLERFFASDFKTTPVDWARRLRCRMARQLIDAGWKNTAVVRELFFGNESHLCHEFHRFYGVSPQTFAPVYRENASPATSRGVVARQ